MLIAAGVQGSLNMSYDSSNLTTPDIKWLGVRPSDLDRFNIPDQCRLPMTEEDIKTGKKLVRAASCLVYVLDHASSSSDAALSCPSCSWKRIGSAATRSGSRSWSSC